jgi:hypothetical protein
MGWSLDPAESVKTIQVDEKIGQVHEIACFGNLESLYHYLRI